MAKQAKQEALPMEPRIEDMPSIAALKAEVDYAREVANLPPPTPGVEAMILKAIESNTPIETMERLLAMRTQLKQEHAKEVFFAALAAAQSQFPIIPKTKQVVVRSEKGTYTYHYAPLDVIVKTVQPILHLNGLSCTFHAEFTDTHVIAECNVYHAGGHAESSEFRAPIDKGARMNDIQKTAAALTYAKRYAYCNALGILSGDEDNDAQTVGNGQQPTETYKLNPEATVEKIRELAEQTHTPVPSICLWGNVEKLGDLTAAQRTKALELLLDKVAKKS